MATQARRYIYSLVSAPYSFPYPALPRMCPLGFFGFISGLSYNDSGCIEYDASVCLPSRRIFTGIRWTVPLRQLS
eukprot:6208091-Pleurochrysis_carterae.AAC.2